MGKLIDINGQKFGSLLVLKRNESNSFKDPQSYWDCLCDCGKLTTISSQDLRRGHTTSCGCQKYVLISDKNTMDISGKIFGRLKVIDFSYIKEHNSYWNCSCECGRTYIVRGSSLVSGNTKSCGCYKVPYNKGIRKLNKEQQDMVFNMKNTGSSSLAIAEKFNVSRSTIDRILLEYQNATRTNS